MNDRARQKAVKKLVKDSEKVQIVRSPSNCPNASQEICEDRGWMREPNVDDLSGGAQAFLHVISLFSTPSTGFRIVSHILAGLHGAAVHQEAPSIRFALSISDQSDAVINAFTTLVKAIVPYGCWKGKHCTLKRAAVLDCRSRRSLTGVHIQDFSKLKIKLHQSPENDLERCKIKLSLPEAYVDTVAAIIGADSAFLREADPFLRKCTTFLIGCSSNDWGAARLTSTEVSAYDPAVIEEIKTHSSKIGSVLRFWWEHDGDGVENESVWAQKVIAEAKASFGKPDSRYVSVTFDPKKMRDAVAYRFFLEFLDFCVHRGWLAGEQAAAYRTGAEEVFDPKPQLDTPLRSMEQPEVFQQIMCQIQADQVDKILQADQPYVKGAKKLGAYREISGELFFIMLEDEWAKCYLKAARKTGVDVSFAQRSNWERELQKILCEAGVIKAPSSGYRYRYDLFGNGTRDKTYVVAVPSMS